MTIKFTNEKIFNIQLNALYARGYDIDSIMKDTLNMRSGDRISVELDPNAEMHSCFISFDVTETITRKVFFGLIPIKKTARWKSSTYGFKLRKNTKYGIFAAAISKDVLKANIYDDGMLELNSISKFFPEVNRRKMFKSMIGHIGFDLLTKLSINKRDKIIKPTNNSEMEILIEKDIIIPLTPIQPGDVRKTMEDTIENLYKRPYKLTKAKQQLKVKLMMSITN